VTREELVMLVNLSREQGLMDDVTGNMMQQLVDFAHIRVHEVLIPRVDLALFDAKRPTAEFLELVRHTRHGRVPVYEGRIDNVVGVVHAKDVLLWPQRPLGEMVRRVLFVPESKTIESLLADFRRLGESMAMVVDEYGGIAGMVTIEDVTEEIVGEIRDEYDRPVESVREEGLNRYSLSGRLGIRDWSELFDIPSGREQFAVDTLGGFVAGLFGRLPTVGGSVTFGNLRFTVESMHRRRIDRVRLEIEEVPDEGEGR
jgi:CBS domain containing-hemolysin-like protein